MIPNCPISNGLPHLFQTTLNMYLQLPQLLETIFEDTKSNDDDKKKQMGFIVYMALAYNLRVWDRSDVGPSLSYQKNIDNYNLQQLKKST